MADGAAIAEAARAAAGQQGGGPRDGGRRTRRSIPRTGQGETSDEREKRSQRTLTAQAGSPHAQHLGPEQAPNGEFGRHAATRDSGAVDTSRFHRVQWLRRSAAPKLCWAPGALAGDRPAARRASGAQYATGRHSRQDAGPGGSVGPANGRAGGRADHAAAKCYPCHESVPYRTRWFHKLQRRAAGAARRLRRNSSAATTRRSRRSAAYHQTPLERPHRTG